MTLEEIQSLSLKEGDMILYQHTVSFLIPGIYKKQDVLRTDVAYYNGLQLEIGDDEIDGHWEIYYLLTKPICLNRINAVDSWVRIQDISKLNKLEIVK